MKTDRYLATSIQVIDYENKTIAFVGTSNGKLLKVSMLWSYNNNEKFTELLSPKVSQVITKVTVKSKSIWNHFGSCDENN